VLKVSTTAETLAKTSIVLALMGKKSLVSIARELIRGRLMNFRELRFESNYTQ
jgi:hypothetical protein